MNSWKDYLHFTRSERSGTIALFVFVTVFFLLPRAYRYYVPPQIDTHQFEATLKEFDEQQDKKGKKKQYAYKSKNKDKKYFPKKKTKNKSRYKKPPAKLFSFNPNTASFADLTSLGLSGKTANILINYREKGGTFYKKEDLKNIYGLTDKDYRRLEAYINIPTKKKKENFDYVAKKDKQTVVKTPPIDLFSFDPNTATFDDFVALGLSKKIAHTLINYREKGGTFYQKEDLQKIYNLETTDFNRLEPYINIAPQPKAVQEPEPKLVVEKSYEEKRTLVNININTATPEEWQQLYGIGPTYAKRIVKFKKVLGGFHSIEQIAETYGMPDSVFQAIRPQLQLGAPTIHKININTASADDLEGHPYLHWKKVKVILAYRKQHGLFESVNDLSNVKAISPELFQKIKPYLTVE